MVIKVFKINRTIFNIALLSFFSLLIIKIHAQNNFKHYTSSDGLAHDVTYNILQDSKGYIWIGTDDGLSKFDGIIFKNYTYANGLTSNYVTDIEELSNYKFAIATWGGGLHFWENDSIFKPQSFNDNNAKIYDIKHHENRIYTKSGSYLFTYNIETNRLESRVYYNNKFFNVVSKSKDSTQLLTTSVIGNNIYVHDQEVFNNNFLGIKKLNTNFLLEDDFTFLSELEIGAVLKINEGFVFGSKNKLLFTDNNKVINHYPIKEISDNERIIKLFQSPNNPSDFILLVRRQSGEKRLLSVNVSNNSVKDLITEYGINTTVSDMLFDFEGNLWITTFGDGVYCCYYSNPIVKTFLEGNYVTDLVKNDKTIFAQTSSTFFELKNGEFSTSFPIDGFVKDLAVVNDKVIISALNLTKKIKHENFEVINGSFYDETKFGTIRQCDTIFINKKIISISNEVFIRLVRENKHYLDFYTNKGKWVYKFNTKKFERDSLFEKKLPSEKINDFLNIDNKEYVATDKGLVVIQGDSIKIFNEKNGLQNERINCIYINNDAIYLGTQSGLSLIKNNQVLNFSKSFGIQSLAINKILQFEDKLWLAGNNGISVININDIKESSAPKLNVNQTSTVFKYDVITYQDKNTINLEYKLNANDWLKINNNNGYLDFKDFAPNTYSIIFRTQNNYSNWIYSKSHNFSIKPPWYKIWWIVLLYIIGSLSIVVLIFYSRLAVISKRNKILQNEIQKRITAENELSEVRNNIARDFHDDLGNKLASISLLSDVLSKKIKSSETNIVKTIKEDADYLYKGTKDFIFSLQEKSNYLEELIIYLTDFSEDYLHQFGIDFEVKSDIDGNVKLPYYWSKQIIFIFKEAITNIVKHSKSKSVFMQFEFIEPKLCISITDDVKGFEAKATSKSGLNNMKSRAKKISCKLEITSLMHRGTTITFIGKLP